MATSSLWSQLISVELTGICGQERMFDSVPVHFTSSMKIGKSVVPKSATLITSAPVVVRQTEQPSHRGLCTLVTIVYVYLANSVLYRLKMAKTLWHPLATLQNLRSLLKSHSIMLFFYIIIISLAC